MRDVRDQFFGNGWGTWSSASHLLGRLVLIGRAQQFRAASYVRGPKVSTVPATEVTTCSDVLTVHGWHMAGLLGTRTIIDLRHGSSWGSSCGTNRVALKGLSGRLPSCSSGRRPPSGRSLRDQADGCRRNCSVVWGPSGSWRRAGKVVRDLRRFSGTRSSGRCRGYALVRVTDGVRGGRRRGHHHSALPGPEMEDQEAAWISRGEVWESLLLRG